MERNEISVQEARAYHIFKTRHGEWLTAKGLATYAKIAPRTARMCGLKLVRLGLLDLAEVWPAHRYRLSEKAPKRNIAYVQRLEAALEVFGIIQAVATTSST